jgi:septal ring-binding cell division protein DamX
MDQSLDLPEPPVLLRSHRPSLTGVWLLVVLAVAVGALLLFRARQAGNPPATSPLPAATTPTAAAALAATVPPTALPPTAAPPTEISATRAPTSRPTPTATAAPRPTATAVAIGAPPRTVAAPGRRQWLARAERDRTLLQRHRHAPYTIQLELVCELSSLEEAWKFDRRGAMWLLTASHRGRECFRVFWGRYATLDEARAAKASVPRFFFTPTNQPAVVSTRSALLR